MLTDVVGDDGADRRIGVRAAFGQSGELPRVGLAVGDRVLKDRRVGGDAHDASGVDQLLQVARCQAVTGQVIQPDRHPRR